MNEFLLTGVLQTKPTFESARCWLCSVVVEHVKQKPAARNKDIHTLLFYLKLYFCHKQCIVIETFRSLYVFIFCKQRWWWSDLQPRSHQKGGLHDYINPCRPGRSPKGASEGGPLLTGWKKPGRQLTSEAWSSLNSGRVLGNERGEQRKRLANVLSFRGNSAS